MINFVTHCRARATDQAVQVMDEAKDSVPSLQLTRHEILTGSVQYKSHVAFHSGGGRLVEGKIFIDPKP